MFFKRINRATTQTLIGIFTKKNSILELAVARKGVIELRILS